MKDRITIRPLRDVVDIARQQINRGMRWFIVCLAACASLASVNCSAQPTKPTEYQVKAAYIYNFGKFVKWPAASAASQNSSFTICVLDEDPFGVILQSTLAGETVFSKPVVIRRILRAQDAANCHILFLNSGNAAHLEETLAALGRASVLTVSDMPEFAQRGGMIQFVLEGDRVRFEINRANAENSGLTLTSDLLKVAVAIRGSVRKGAP